MSWFGGRSDNWDDERYYDERDSEFRGRDEDYVVRRPWWQSALRSVTPKRREDILVIAAVPICWLVAASNQGELYSLLSLLAAVAASVVALWWLYHRTEGQWLSPARTPVSAEALESGMGSSASSRVGSLRRARLLIVGLTGATISFAVMGSALGGTSRVYTAQDELPVEVQQLDAAVRSTASGGDTAAVRRAWMLAGARPASSGVSVTGVLGQRVWLEIAAADTPKTLCLEIADYDTPAKRTACAGISTSINRGPAQMAPRQ